MKAGSNINRSPVNVGIIGAGNVLFAYLQVLDRLTPRGQARLGVVCCRRRENWPGLLARRPDLNLVQSAREVVESDADVVVILTSPESHAELTALTLEHGKHVVVEKPLAPTCAKAESLARLAADRRVHLLAAPFVQMAPTFRAMWGAIQEGTIGTVHSARGLYGNAGSTWARWYHDGSIGPLAEIGIYNLKSLTALLGPVVEIHAASTIAVRQRVMENGAEIANPGDDVSHIIARHETGALSSIVSSHAIQRYRRPGLELYGTEGTANLLGDDWDPRGFEIWRNQAGRWEEYEPIEPTWLWADGLSELIAALREQRRPLAEISHDVHLIEVLDAAERSAKERAWIPVHSRFRPLDLKPDAVTGLKDVHHLHDHTRPAEDQ
jgi:predicted dehydrogenase